jgi:PAS domain S-box-containing protein
MYSAFSPWVFACLAWLSPVMLMLNWSAAPADPCDLMDIAQDRPVGFRLYTWPAVTVILVLLRVVLSHTLQRAAFDAYNKLVVFVLLLLCTGFATLNAQEKTQGSRAFWAFLAAGFALWAVDAWLWVYYPTILRQDIPDASIADAALFLHVAPFMAALATRPHLNESNQKLYRSTLNFFLLLFFWVFLYAYLVFPYQVRFHDSAIYGVPYDRLYVLESLVWIAALGILLVRSQNPWKAIYGHLFIASGIYAISSWFANLDVESNSYRGATLYGLGLLASRCWFVWALLRARQLTPNPARRSTHDTSDAKYTPLFAIVVVGAIALMALEEAFQFEPAPGYHRMRMIVILGFVFLFAMSVLVKEYLDNRELIGKVKSTEALQSAILSSLDNEIAVLDKNGCIVTVNHAWRRFGMENPESPNGLGPGANYLAACQTVAATSPDMQEVIAGIKAVQDRSLPLFLREGASLSAIRQNWYLMTVTPLDTMEGGVVVSRKDITALKETEAALRESEARFRSMADTTPVLMWMASPDMLATYFNQNWLDFTGRSLTEELGNGWVASVHPEDVPRCHQLYLEAFASRERFRMEFRLRRHDGEYRWIVDMGVPMFNADNSFAGYLGSCMDVTDHKLAEEMLHNLSRRLIEAQEQERRRIARDLHDDINQRLALLGVKIGALKRHLPLSQEELLERLRDLSERTSDIANGIHAISHKLHSSQLDYLGLVSAVEGLCTEFSSQQHVEIDFVHHDVPTALPQTVSLCLFRVLQETLSNAVKHSGSTRFEAQLWGSSGKIHLTVRDSGVGFDVNAAQRATGLGLISMRERVHSVNGTMAILSKREYGTEVRVTVPIEAALSQAQS